MQSSTPAGRVLVRRVEDSLRRAALDEAGALLEDLRELEPLAVHTRALELELLVRRGRSQDALALGRQLAKLHPTSPRVLFWAGRAAIACRRHDEAATLLRESVRLARRSETERWLARALVHAGRFDEAEPILLSILDARPRARIDLALLYERRGDLPRALRALEELARERPHDAYLRRELLRLRAASSAPVDLVQEMEDLAALGESVPRELRSPYLHALLSTGAARKARELLAAILPELTAFEATQLGWTAHHCHAYDISFELFSRALPERLDDVKLRSALERAAAQAGRLGVLADAYAALAPRHPPLHGVVKRLRRLAGGS